MVRTYDSRIKAGKITKFRPPQNLSDNILANRNSMEMVIISKENILIGVTLRQKNFVVCTHKAHF